MRNRVLAPPFGKYNFTHILLISFFNLLEYSTTLSISKKAHVTSSWACRKNPCLINQSFIHIFSMADADNYDQDFFVKDLINNTIYPRAKAVKVLTASNLFAVRWSWIIFQLCEFFSKLSLNFMVLASDKISGVCGKLNLIHPCYSFNSFIKSSRSMKFPFLIASFAVSRSIISSIASRASRSS